MAIKKIGEFMLYDNLIEIKSVRSVSRWGYSHSSLYFYVNGKRSSRSKIEQLLLKLSEFKNTREQEFLGMVSSLKMYNAPKLVMEALLVELDKYMTENTVDENIIKQIMEKVDD